MVARWPLVVPLLALIYLPFISGGLLTDDFAHVVHLSGIDSAQRLIDRPDAFGFYRPVTQLSMAVAPGGRGERPALARAINIVLHMGVISLAFIVASLVLQSTFAAGLAALPFALTPKAPAIAVLWISARGELLMASLSLAAMAAWIVWTRKGRGWWLAAAVAAYGLALLSKETATLLPLLLLLTPRSERPFAARAGAVIGFIALALIIYAWRSGALTPFAGDEHYSLEISVSLWLRNAINYAGRMIVAPLGLVALLALGRLIDRRLSMPADSHAHWPIGKDGPYQADVVVFAVACVVIFLAPVLPITLRSELYLYLPVFGVCLLAGRLGAWLLGRIELSHGRLKAAPAMAAAVALYILGFGSYQIARARDIQQDLIFSEKLVTAIRANAQIASTPRAVLLIPLDAATERSLQGAIGGYLYLVLQHAFAGTPRAGAVQYTGDPPHQADVRLVCAYRQREGTVVISPAP
jgi:hypothetical protein